MSFRILSGKRTYSVVWTTDTCAKRRVIESPVFKLENCEWSFLLQLEPCSRNDVEWQMFLNKIRPAQGNHILIVNTSIENKKRIIECMNYSKIRMNKPASERILWRSKLQIEDNYPDITLDGDVTFIVTFLSDYRHFPDLIDGEVNRSIQTPHYLDVHPCLDTLRSNFGKMFEDGLYTDVELVCGERVLHAHKAILIARSEVFAAMLSNDMLEKKKSSIEIVDMSHDILEEFLKYLYTGTLPEMNIDTAAGLYEAGDKYAIETLKSRCTHFLMEHLMDVNACMLLALADAHSDECLKEFVMSYITRNDMLVKIREQLSDEYPHLAFDKIYGAHTSQPPDCLKK